MGLLKAAGGAVGGVLGDQWREFFYCDSMDADVLVTKGQKRVDPNRSSNTHGTDNIITNGATIAINEGQAICIIDQGKVVEFSAEPGEFVWDTSSQPSIFYGGLGKGLLDSFKQFGRRVGFGGDAGADQRIYFFNLKEIVGNKYGTPTPVPFRVVDANVGLDVDISVRCNGEYSFKMVDPMRFFVNVCGNIEGDYTRDMIASQMKSELLTQLQPAFAQISAMGVRYSAVPAHTSEMCDALDQLLTEKWTNLRGLRIVSFGMNSISASEEDEKLIKDMQKAGALRDPNMRAAVTTSAAADAMRTAAGNEAGAMTGFMGVGMGGMMSNQFTNAAIQMPTGQAPEYPNQYGVAAGGGFAQPQQAAAGNAAAGAAAAAPAGAAAGGAAGEWTCACGTVNDGRFCHECGQPKPEPQPAPASDTWTCACGAVNTGKFCPECGSKRPEAPKRYKCDKCGWEPSDPTNPPKFCPECGDPFNDGDVVS